VDVTVKEIKEKVLPPLDDELARAASEFETLAELRAEIESRLREQVDEEAESAFRANVVDALVDAAKLDPSGPLVDARTRSLLTELARSLERRGISLENYLRLTGQEPAQLEESLRSEAKRSVSRDLVLEAVAERLAIEISDEEVKAFIREQAEATGEDADALISSLWESGRHERIREDLRLRSALDLVAADVKRIPQSLASAREKLWTPEKEKTPADTKLWTPGSKERA
jgi:trigger factor